MNTDSMTRRDKALVMAYYNQYLLDHKFITHQKYYQMANLIWAKYPMKKQSK